MHSDDSNFVLTTEGHILKLPPSTLVPVSPARRLMRGSEQHTCPVPIPVYAAYDWVTETGLIQSVRARPDVDFARYLGGMAAQPADEYLYTPDGWCIAPKVELFVSVTLYFKPARLLTLHESHTTSFYLKPAKMCQKTLTLVLRK